MRKQFVVPVLREEAALAQLTLGAIGISRCGVCQDGTDGAGGVSSWLARRVPHTENARPAGRFPCCEAA